MSFSTGLNYSHWDSCLMLHRGKIFSNVHSNQDFPRTGDQDSLLVKRRNDNHSPERQINQKNLGQYTDFEMFICQKIKTIYVINRTIKRPTSLCHKHKTKRAYMRTHCTYQSPSKTDNSNKRENIIGIRRYSGSTKIQATKNIGTFYIWRS